MVGPRPIVEAEIEKYGEYIKDYYLVTPGITGLWQVNGRSDTTYSERVAMDTWYVRNWSVWIGRSLFVQNSKNCFKAKKCILKMQQENQWENNCMENQKVSVIIPTLNAGKEIEDLLQALLKQNKKADEIIVIDSASDDDTTSICEKYNEVKLLNIERQQFDHGATRAIAFNQAIGEFVLFLTQDTIPADEQYISKLLVPFKDEKVAMVSGRQCAKATSRLSERLAREFNYPLKSNVRSQGDIKQLGIKEIAGLLKIGK
ncbi:hypothetical protein SDC9_112680 [bioreactor metagenome]|uniref:Glycosyltransferase 2-like domain-containing protein n=1 Tax=bioreactor metagenome TaxID=1076179 RepID=A0A645BKZ5_9ZZZZ